MNMNASVLHCDHLIQTSGSLDTTKLALVRCRMLHDFLRIAANPVRLVGERCSYCFIFIAVIIAM